MDPTTSTMKAALLETAGGPMRIVQVPIPVLQAGQALVRIHASGVNPLDLKIRQGAAAHARHPLPAILGIDLAGTIEALGAGVTGFRVGDKVYGMAGGVGGVPGSLAEYAASDARLLAKMPGNLSMREAASLPLVFITAWEGLVDRARVSAGQRVLIQGGAGGVGQIAVQLAQAFGARTFATGSASDAKFLKSLGAVAIDRNTPVEEQVAQHTDGQGFDLIYDTVGGAVLDASFKAVHRFGHVVSALGWGTHALAPLSFRAGTYSGVFTLLPLLTGEGREHHGEIMREATRLIEAGKIVPRVDPRRFSQEAALEAHDAIEQKQAVGKLVVDLIA